MMDVNRYIQRKFRVKGGESSPFTGWLASNRSHLAELFFELGYKVGAEIGVQAGRNAYVLFQKNPNLKLFCVDPWAPWSGGRPTQHRQNMFFYYTKRRLAGCNVVFIRKTSMEALSEISDGSLDFVYIDGQHDFDNAMMDIIEWSKKVRTGGIVSGHDYLHGPKLGVIPAVRAYVEGHCINEWYITNESVEKPSYFWVKS